METEFPLSISREQRHSETRSDQPAREGGFEEVIKDIEPKSAKPTKKAPEEGPIEDEQSEEASSEIPELGMIGPLILDLVDLVKASQSPKSQLELQGKNLREQPKGRNKIPLVGKSKTEAAQQDAPRQAMGREALEAKVKADTSTLLPSAKPSSQVALDGMQKSLEPMIMRPGAAMPPAISSSSPTTSSNVVLPQHLEVRTFRANAEGGETRMRVNLADGDVLDLKFIVRDSVANVTLRTTRPEMVKLLQESIHELVANLESQGLEVGVDIGHEPRDQSGEETMAHFVQKEQKESVEDGGVVEVLKREPAWHYLTIRGRIYVVA